MNDACHARRHRPPSWIALLTLLVLASPATLASEPLASTFTYQGELRFQGQPANAAFDMEFRLYDADAGGSQLGAVVARPAVAVQQGLFSVPLDFGQAPLAGDRRWLELRVRPAGSGAFETLSPRTELTAAPYAWAAAHALPASVSAGSIVDGSVGTSAINAAQVQRRVTGSCPAGQHVRQINQNGTVVCGSEASDPEAWRRGGNAGTNPASDFLGTSDQQSFVIRTWNAPSLRIEPSDILFQDLPITTNTIAGSHANEVTPGVRGATIAGGGVPEGNSDPNFLNERPHRITDSFGTIGGGYANQAGDGEGTANDRAFATVAGGGGNTASGLASTVGGGTGNTASNNRTTISGGDRNEASAEWASVGGGLFNRAQGVYGVVAGGTENFASGLASTVGGGAANSSSGDYGSIGGGLQNVASGHTSHTGGGYLNVASGQGSAIGGGVGNAASGSWATVPGGAGNCAGAMFSLAAGRRAKVRPGSHSGALGPTCTSVPVTGTSGDQGSFAWADQQESDFVSNGENQFLVRASGSVQFTHDNNVTTNTVGWFRIRAPEGRSPLTVTTGGAGVLTGFSNSGVRIGNTTGLFPPTPADNGLLVMGGARRNDNQSTWDTTSDARVKRDIVTLVGAVDAVLALRPTRFRYRAEHLEQYGGEDREHLGYIAQELAEVLPQSVHPAADESGLLQVNLSEVQVLTTAATRELAIAQQAISEELLELRAENAALRRDLEALKALLLERTGGR